MRNSFTNAVSKNLIHLDTKLWLFFSLTLVVFFLSVDIFILAKTYALQDRNNLYLEKTTKLEEKITHIANERKYIKHQINLASDVVSNNIVLKDSIQNLFDLIPEQVYLTQAIIDKKSLELRGYTPSKELFNNLLMPPLKSIFTNSTVVYLPAGNGWFKFVSKNSSKENFLYEK